MPHIAHRRAGPVQRRRHHDGLRRCLPLLPGASYRNWKLPDPAGQPLDVVRMIRDDIADRVQALIAELLATAKTR